MDVRLLEATDDPDDLICRAARNDYAADFVVDEEFATVMDDIDGATVAEKRRNLITHLLDHGHFGPFEHPHATFGIEGISRSCMAQLTRHRHVSFDVQSMRYVAFDDVDPSSVGSGELVVVPPSTTDPDWVGRNQDAGSVDEETIEHRSAVFAEAVEQSVTAYQDLLESGMAPEDARFVLPIGTKVNVVMTMNARMLMHVGDMRAAGDAQWEIREMTEQILELAREWAPISFEHYMEELHGRKNRLAP
ncbi:FAD-dependent thymidylate synthase [Halococcoides cellulosivorans]|uniref:Flavin-dependent thymidylate synthase n=1 Tax=Halococcoides cellulosivorans TaxID=1679096 RepID=A0A2R4X128_9EURY|nr:FAD-dependent thymidylate synthase [Halococcoides cellulosivorans]AWB27502.1 FAD-dependent thymidylate synthase [Halococcoides cellulosivorans]